MRRITFAELKGLLTKDRDRAVEATVKEIIEEVRKKGDTALKRYTKKFDGVRDLQIKVSDKEICKAREGIDSKIISVIESAKKRIENTIRNRCLGLCFEGKIYPYNLSFPCGECRVYTRRAITLMSSVLMTVIPLMWQA